MSSTVLNQVGSSGPLAQAQWRVPFTRPYISEAAIAAAVATLKSGWVGQGPQGEALERQFAEIVSAPHAAAVSSAAAGIRLLLAVHNIGAGDEVITTPLTWQAMNHPILEQGATAVFADVQYDTGNMDPVSVEQHITQKTRAILCWHWAGNPADLKELQEIARRHKLLLLDDATEALGATYHGQPLGSGQSDATVFSFYAVQIVMAVEGGMIATGNKDLHEAILRRRWFGIDRKRRKPRLDGYYDYDVTEVGYNYPLMDLNAAIGKAHLTELPQLLQRRRAIVERYRMALGGVSGVRLFPQQMDRQSGEHLFTIHVERKDDFCGAMQSRGVDVAVFHVRNDQYQIFGGRRSDLPQLDAFEKTYINLPLYSTMTDVDVEHVISSVIAGW